MRYFNPDSNTQKKNTINDALDLFEGAKSHPESTDQTNQSFRSERAYKLSSLITGSTNTFEEEVSAADFPMPQTGTGACMSRAQSVTKHSI